MHEAFNAIIGEENPWCTGAIAIGKRSQTTYEQDKNKFLINQFAASFSIIQHQSFCYDCCVVVGVHSGGGGGGVGYF